MPNLKLSKHTIIILTLLALSSLCAILYAANGSYVDENGFLREQFGFIPLAFLFLFLAVVYALYALLKPYARFLLSRLFK